LKDMSALENYIWSSLPNYLSKKKSRLLAKSYLLKGFNTSRELLDFTMAGFDKNTKDALAGLTIDDDFKWFSRKGKKKDRQIW